MSKYQKDIEKKREKEFDKAQAYFDQGNYDYAKKIFKKLLKYYKSRSIMKYYRVLLNLIKLYNKNSWFI